MDEVILPLDKGTFAGLELWRAAMRWRRRAERTLTAFDLTITQWFVLLATQVVVQETGDATTQNAVAEWAELDRATVSTVMRVLEQKGLVDRGPHAERIAYRLWVTPRGVRILSGASSAVAETSSVSLLSFLVLEEEAEGAASLETIRYVVDQRVLDALHRVR
jgi:DNA-binding MarR family transcriptional regulator